MILDYEKIVKTLNDVLTNNDNITKTETIYSNVINGLTKKGEKKIINMLIVNILKLNRIKEEKNLKQQINIDTILSMIDKEIMKEIKEGITWMDYDINIKPLIILQEFIISKTTEEKLIKELKKIVKD